MREMAHGAVTISLAIVFCFRNGFLQILSRTAGALVSCGLPLFGLLQTEEVSLYRFIVRYIIFLLNTNTYEKMKILVTDS